MKPHKHATVIKAWADGAVVESRHFPYDSWSVSHAPQWIDGWEYRVKPKEKSYGQVGYEAAVELDPHAAAMLAWERVTIKQWYEDAAKAVINEYRFREAKERQVR